MQVPFHLASAYKYTSCETLRLIVQNQTLRFTRADALNDIFEMSPFILPLDWVELTELAKSNFKLARNISNLAYDRICSSLFVTCFCKSYTTTESQLMWAHYGNSHKGVCIEVDFKLLGADETGRRYRPVAVTYVDSLLIERNLRAPSSEDLPLFITTYKNKVWAYEDEVRVVLETESLDKTQYVAVPEKLSIDVAFNPVAIRKVIFGLKSQPKEIHNVVSAFGSMSISPCFVRLDIDPLTLKIVEIPLTLTVEKRENLP
jgi:hypothetical protein